MKLRIGSHKGPGGKHALSALQQIVDEGGTAVQMFAGNPKRWWPSRIDDCGQPEYLDYSSQVDVYQMVHSVYICNLCEKPDQRAARMHKLSIERQLEWCESMGMTSMVFHPGSAKDYDRGDSVGWLIEAVMEVMGSYQGPVRLLLENKAVKNERLTGRKGTQRGITGNLNELADIVLAVKDPRVGICVDTTHCYASGYSVPMMIDAITDPVVWPLVDVIHMNTPNLEVQQGSGMDRHNSAFDGGKFTMKELQDLFNALKEKVLILEGTPDFPADLAWLLRWELESRDGEIPALPPVDVARGDDPSEIGDASVIP